MLQSFQNCESSSTVLEAQAVPSAASFVKALSCTLLRRKPRRIESAKTLATPWDMGGLRRGMSVAPEGIPGAWPSYS